VTSNSSLGERARGWLGERIPVKPEDLRSSLDEPVPGHMRRWWFCLGGTPAYLFLVQCVTGMLLTFYYVPDPARAYESVARISQEVPFGWWVRGLHKWSATFMIIALVLHVLRVYFTAAYRKPRELTWVTGAIVLLLTFVLGFTGYSLVFEQLSYWGATVAANLTATVPFVGEPLARFIRGGDVIGADTITRFYIFHIGVLPTLLVICLVAHIGLIRLHGVTELHFADETPEEGEFRFFPDHMLTELGLGLFLMVMLTCFAVIFPPELSDKANPLMTPTHIKPEWYFYFTFRWLKLAGLTVAVLSLGLGAFLFVFWPFVDSFLQRVLKQDVADLVGIVVFLAILVLTVWEAVAH